MSNPNTISLPLTCSKIDGDWIHSNKGIYFRAFCIPIQFVEELKEIVIHRAILKKVFDDSMGEVYQLMNKISLYKD